MDTFSPLIGMSVRFQLGTSNHCSANLVDVQITEFQVCSYKHLISLTYQACMHIFFLSMLLGGLVDCLLSPRISSVRLFYWTAPPYLTFQNTWEWKGSICRLQLLWLCICCTFGMRLVIRFLYRNLSTDQRLQSWSWLITFYHWPVKKSRYQVTAVIYLFIWFVWIVIRRFY